jgi:hypothetical protein
MFFGTRSKEITMPLSNNELCAVTLARYVDSELIFEQETITTALGLSKSGFCNMFCMQYLIDVLNQENTVPKRVFTEMKVKGPTYFKQIMQNQDSYVKNFSKINYGAVHSGKNLEFESTNENKQLISLLSRSKRGTLPVKKVIYSSDDFIRNIKSETMLLPDRTCCCLVQFYMKDGLDEVTGGHALAFVCQNSSSQKWFALDPNMGLLQFREGELSGIAANFWGMYQPANLVITAVI